MSDSRTLPGARAPLVNPDGTTRREFYDFFRRLEQGTAEPAEPVAPAEPGVTGAISPLGLVGQSVTLQQIGQGEGGELVGVTVDSFGRVSATRPVVAGDGITIDGTTDPAEIAISSDRMDNPMTTLGDLIRAETGGVPERLPVGTNGQVLTVVSGEPSWATSTALVNPMTTAEDLIKGGAGGAPARLGVGTNGQVLTVTSGAVGWATPSGLTNPMTTAGDIITGGASGAPQRLGVGSAGQVLTVVSGVPAWAAASGGGSNPFASRFVGSVFANPNSSAVTATGLTAPSTTGSTGGGTIASTNVFNSLPRRTLNATAATNAIAGQRSADGNFLFRGNASRVGGFRIVQRIGVGTGGTIASHRLFVGISDATIAPTDVNPSTLTNVVLFGYDSGDTNCQVMHNDGSGTATKIDLGASFPKPTTANEKAYDFDLSCAANSSSYSYTVTDITNGNTASGTISTDIPANTLLMNWRHWMSAGGTSTAILLAFYFLYVDSAT